MSRHSVDAVAQEIAQEKAQALALTSRALEGALRALREHDERGGALDDTRRRLVAQAAERVLNYLVQCEAHGLRDTRYVLDYFAVPAEVIAKLGIRGSP